MRAKNVLTIVNVCMSALCGNQLVLGNFMAAFAFLVAAILAGACVVLMVRVEGMAGIIKIYQDGLKEMEKTLKD